MNPTPTIGRIVLYTLSAADAVMINRRRTDAGHIHQRVRTGDWPAGAQAHIGNQAEAGQVFPAIVVAVNAEGRPSIQVFLDGTDNFWVQGAEVSNEGQAGMYHWMPYQKTLEQKAAAQAEVLLIGQAPMPQAQTIVSPPARQMTQSTPVTEDGTVIDPLPTSDPIPLGDPSSDNELTGNATDTPDQEA